MEVLFSAETPGLWAKRSGRGVFVDLMVRTGMYDGAALCWKRGMRERVDDGRRKVGGRSAQLTGALGGIVVVVGCGVICGVV